MTFSTTSAVKSDEVDEFIAQEQSKLDARLSQKYSDLPIVSTTHADAYRIVRTILTYYVTQRVKDILQVKNADDKVTQDTRATNLRLIADQMVKDIVNGDLILPGVPLVESGAGVKSYTGRNRLSGYFKVGKTQW